MLSVEETYEALGSGATWRVVRRDGVAVAGPDAGTWLQGQLSQDLDPVGVGGWVESLVLSPQGKLVVSCRVWRTLEERYVLEVETGFGALLAERLERFRLRVKANVAGVGLSVLEVRGPQSSRPSSLPASSGLVAPVTWPGFEGFDEMSESDGEGSWGGAGAAARGTAAPGAARTRAAAATEAMGDPGADEAFEAARIEAGVPRLGHELDERTIPQEAGEAFVGRTVSFDKGCYTGQELVARLDARGSNTPRRLRGVVLSEPAAERGEALVVDGATVGELTSVARSPGRDGLVGLAYVKRSVAPPCDSSLGRIRALPLGRR